MAERWKTIPGFGSRYEVSDQGNVRALSFLQRYLLRTGVEAFRRTAPHAMAKQLINSGYQIVHLHFNGERTARTVHTLVAEAFVPGSGATVNHRDTNKLNNAASNLDWESYTVNHLHAVACGMNAQAIAVVNPATGEHFASISQAARSCRRSVRTIRKEWVRA